MNFKLSFAPLFERELKSLSKKHSSLKSDLLKLTNSLTKDPKQGKPLGNNCYKIRVAISSKNKGKSGGARIITYVKIVEETIYLISIYDKSDTDTIAHNELIERTKGL